MFKTVNHNCMVRELFLFIMGLNATSSSKFISPVDLENIVHLSVPAFESSFVISDFILRSLAQVDYTHRNVSIYKKN